MPSQPSYYIWASDPHAKGQSWINLVKEAQYDYPTAQTIFGGDYIDGGKYANETIQFVMDQVQEHHAQALLGNHEQIMRDFVETFDDLWYHNGAKSTIKSFFGRGFSKKTAQHLLRSDNRYRFLKNLPKILITPHIIFVHAGIACWEPNNYQDPNIYKPLLPLFAFMDPQEYFYLWSREDYWYGPRKPKDDNMTFAHNLTGKTIVTGHTPTTFLMGNFENSNTYIENTFNYMTWSDDDPLLLQRPCPVRMVKYPHEAPRFFTDDGCHGSNHHFGNVCVFDNLGHLIKIYNHDTNIKPYNDPEEGIVNLKQPLWNPKTHQYDWK